MIGYLAGGLLAIAVASAWLLSPNGPYTRSLFRSAENLTKQSHDSYVFGTFESATNALQVEINFYERHRERLAHQLRVDGRLKTSYSQLAYMLMHAGETEGDDRYLREAHLCHNRTLAGQENEDAMNCEEFFEFFLRGMEYIDGRTGAKWKADFTLREDKVDHLRKLFCVSGTSSAGREVPAA
jgi:hypothetical protein